MRDDRYILVVHGDKKTQRIVHRILGATFCPVHVVDTIAQAEARIAERRPFLLVVDHAQAIGARARAVLAEHHGLPSLVLMHDAEEGDVPDVLDVDSLSYLMANPMPLLAEEMIATVLKLLRREIFGLEKYLAWGVRVGERVVRTYEAKREAMGEVTGYAKEVGARRPVIAKIESVVDELLMNALYDAPAAAGGTRPPPVTGNNEPPPEARAVLRWACDGRYFAVSVEDAFGALRKDAIVEHLARARSERGRPRPGHEGNGAGLGLYFILSSVTRFVANIEPGKRTEVVCLFDLKQAGRDADACARSLHVFGA